MKKILALVLALVMVFALAACGDSGNDTGDNGGDNAEGETVELTLTCNGTEQGNDTRRCPPLQGAH